MKQATTFCHVCFAMAGAFTAAHALCAEPSQQPIILHAFNEQDGSGPVGQLAIDSKGDIYGTTESGGKNGGGVLFQLRPAGDHHNYAYVELYDWVARSTTDNGGQIPFGRVTVTPEGDLIGTTEAGGPDNYGTIWRYDMQSGVVDPKNMTILHKFDGTDGIWPKSGLSEPDKNGNMYGTTELGGATYELSSPTSSGVGEVYSINPQARTFKVVHSFELTTQNCPVSDVICDDHVNLWGTTLYGSASTGGPFEIEASGSYDALTASPVDGYNGNAGLLMDKNGQYLYGVMQNGPGSAYGSIYRVDMQERSVEVLYEFNTPNKGAAPTGTLVTDGQGSFYGTASADYPPAAITETNSSRPVPTGNGCVFEWSQSKGLTILHQFDKADGSNPMAGLTRDSEGNLFGVTKSGGENGFGEVFEISVKPSPNS